MDNDWILDVLADLKSFARQNGFVALAEQLDDTKLIAATELTTAAACVPRLVRDGSDTGTYTRSHRAGADA